MHKIDGKDYKCKMIKNISEYYDKENQKNEYCNILISNMYYWMPINLSNLENKGIEKSSWRNSDLRSASKEIFWKWRKCIELLKNK